VRPHWGYMQLISVPNTTRGAALGAGSALSGTKKRPPSTGTRPRFGSSSQTGWVRSAAAIRPNALDLRRTHHRLQIERRTRSVGEPRVQVQISRVAHARLLVTEIAHESPRLHGEHDHLVIATKLRGERGTGLHPSISCRYPGPDLLEPSVTRLNRPLSHHVTIGLIKARHGDGCPAVGLEVPYLLAG
jgi:hypothetical protein